MSGRPHSIEVAGLEKTFRVPKHHVHTLKERALHPFRPTEYRVLDVLKGVSLDVDRGEFFGIVGRNGSGKSTLLKCLAGIYKADRGAIRIAGRLAPFIELGVGFNPDLTARDNVVINGVMMGLTPREARARFDEVIEFAELGDYLDLKLKNYSSGMQVRLAFAVMVQSDADVLLIDEVLAVGDAAFQQKCLDVFYGLREQGKTIVLVTHDMSMVERFCHRALLIKDGLVDLMGDPKEVGRAYLNVNFESRESEVDPGTFYPAATLVDAWLEDAEGRRGSALVSGDPMTIKLVLEAHEDIDWPRVVVDVRDNEGVVVCGAIAGDGLELGDVLSPGERVTMQVGMTPALADGRYFVGLSMTRGSSGQDLIIDLGRATDFVVHSADDVVGLLKVPTTFDVTRDTRGSSGERVQRST